MSCFWYSWCIAIASVTCITTRPTNTKCPLCAGAFHVKMRKASQKDKLYQAFYNPVEPGIYTIYVQWSGHHITGSPYTVLLARNKDELYRLQRDGSVTSNFSKPPSPRDVLY